MALWLKRLLLGGFSRFLLLVDLNEKQATIAAGWSFYVKSC
jgi:hypothetical protein